MIRKLWRLYVERALLGVYGFPIEQRDHAAQVLARIPTTPWGA